MISAIPLLVLAASPQHGQTAPVHQVAQLVTVKQVKLFEGVRALALAPSPKGSLFAASLEDNSVEIINAATHQVVRKFVGHPSQVYAIAWSHDGELLATGDESARIMIWNAETGAKLREMREHTRGIQNLSFNYPRTLLLSTGKDDVVKIWDVGSGRVKKTVLGEGANFYSATFRGRTNSWGVGILTGYGGREYSDEGKTMGFFTGHNNQGVFDIGFNAAGTKVVTAGRDGTGAVWNEAGHQRLGSLTGHMDYVNHCAFSPNGQWVATSSTDRTVRLWNPYSFQQVQVLNDESAVGSPLCFTADGKYLATVNISDYLQINALTPPQPSSGADSGFTKTTRKRHHRA